MIGKMKKLLPVAATMKEWLPEIAALVVIGTLLGLSSAGCGSGRSGTGKAPAVSSTPTPAPSASFTPAPDSNSVPTPLGDGPLPDFSGDDNPHAPVEAALNMETWRAAFDINAQPYIRYDGANYRATNWRDVTVTNVDGKQTFLTVTPVERQSDHAASIRLGYRIGSAWVTSVMTTRDYNNIVAVGRDGRARPEVSPQTRGFLTNWWKSVWDRVKDKLKSALSQLGKQLADKVVAMLNNLIDQASMVGKDLIGKIPDDALAATLGSLGTQPSATPPATKMASAVRAGIAVDQKTSAAFVEAIRSNQR